MGCNCCNPQQNKLQLAMSGKVITRRMLNSGETFIFGDSQNVTWQDIEHMTCDFETGSDLKVNPALSRGDLLNSFATWRSFEIQPSASVPSPAKALASAPYLKFCLTDRFLVIFFLLLARVIGPSRRKLSMWELQWMWKVIWFLIILSADRESLDRIQ